MSDHERTDGTRARTEAGPHGALRAAASIAVLIGAVGSVSMMLYTGRRNASRLLLALFAIWVLSPFMLLAVADAASNRWPARTRTMLSSLMVALALGSLVIYGLVALWPGSARPVPAFVAVPPASWLLIVVALATSTLASRPPAERRGDG